MSQGPYCDSFVNRPATSLIKLFYPSHCFVVCFRRTEISFEEFFKSQLLCFVYLLYGREGSQGCRGSYSDIVGSATTKNIMKSNDIWLRLLAFHINMLDSVAMLACMVLQWLVAGKGSWTSLALVALFRFDMLAFTFDQISSRVRERNVLQVG